MLAMVALTGCAGGSALDDIAAESTSFELISEQYIRGPGDTIGSDGPRAMGTTVCTYFNRETNARVVRRQPGAMPCPPVL
jgi:hypothetical protein